MRSLPICGGLPSTFLDTDKADTTQAGSGAGPSLPETGEPWGEFRIIREIGRGGMGVVCEAFQGSLNRHVALKFLPEHGDLARFRREARAAGRLHHTNIVPVFGVGEHERAALLRHAVYRRARARRRAERAAPSPPALGTVRRPRGGPDRRAGRRGAGVCPCTRRDPSRYQAVEPPARRTGDSLGHRLRPGPRCQRYPHTDAHRRFFGNTSLRGPGAVERPRGRAGRYLRAGRHALRAGLRPSGVRGRGPVGARCTRFCTRTRPGHGSAAGDRPRPGDDHPQGDGAGPGSSGMRRPRRWRRTCGGSWRTGRSGRAATRRWERAWRWSRRNKVVAGLLAALVVVFLAGFAGVTSSGGGPTPSGGRAHQLAEADSTAAPGPGRDCFPRFSIKGLEFAQGGDFDYGLLWMAEALAEAPPEQARLRQDRVRTNLAAWEGRVFAPARSSSIPELFTTPASASTAESS